MSRANCILHIACLPRLICPICVRDCLPNDDLDPTVLPGRFQNGKLPQPHSLDVMEERALAEHQQCQARPLPALFLNSHEKP
jgi:hypothetical protein